jgi:hypothetical protein
MAKAARATTKPSIKYLIARLTNSVISSILLIYNINKQKNQNQYNIKTL